MNLLLTRDDSTPDGIFSTLTDTNGNPVASCLEHSYEQPDGTWQPKVPPGVYSCVRGTHQLDNGKPPFETFEVTGVAGHTGILFHVGNFNSDSEGCILLGRRRVMNEVVGSALAFGDFMAAQEGCDSFQLEVK